MVGRYPTNDLMGRGPRLRQLALFLSRAYAGLARLSACYPPPEGMFPRVPQPCATGGRSLPCDLHALGTPPAFVLSQDQTLHCVEWSRAEAREPPTAHWLCCVVHHHDSVVKVQMGHATLRRIKNQGRSDDATDTWRRFRRTSRPARFAKSEKPNPELLRLRPRP